MTGRKDDGADGKLPRKLRWSLVPWTAMEAVVRVLMLGAQKYSDHNWLKVDNHRERYFDALMRHSTAWRRGEKYDPETGENHLAHAVCCALFLMAREDEP